MPEGITLANFFRLALRAVRRLNVHKKTFACRRLDSGCNHLAEQDTVVIGMDSTHPVGWVIQKLHAGADDGSVCCPRESSHSSMPAPLRAETRSTGMPGRTA